MHSSAIVGTVVCQRRKSNLLGSRVEFQSGGYRRGIRSRGDHGRWIRRTESLLRPHCSIIDDGFHRNILSISKFTTDTSLGFRIGKNAKMPSGTSILRIGTNLLLHARLLPASRRLHLFHRDYQRSRRLHKRGDGTRRSQQPTRHRLGGMRIRNRHRPRRDPTGKVRRSDEGVQARHPGVHRALPRVGPPVGIDGTQAREGAGPARGIAVPAGIFRGSGAADQCRTRRGRDLSGRRDGGGERAAIRRQLVFGVARSGGGKGGEVGLPDTAQCSVISE
mmetsp:Transcript_9949/g.18165  ORF Transcript_9949/g.18165 Transcript_9949/m.18165 type:complete len:277 (+) Transcript_9949:951-1781(+)